MFEINNIYYRNNYTKNVFSNFLNNYIYENNLFYIYENNLFYIYENNYIYDNNLFYKDIINLSDNLFIKNFFLKRLKNKTNIIMI